MFACFLQFDKLCVYNNGAFKWHKIYEYYVNNSKWNDLIFTWFALRYVVSRPSQVTKALNLNSRSVFEAWRIGAWDHPVSAGWIRRPLETAGAVVVRNASE